MYASLRIPEAGSSANPRHLDLREFLPCPHASRLTLFAGPPAGGLVSLASALPPCSAPLYLYELIFFISRASVLSYCTCTTYVNLATPVPFHTRPFFCTCIQCNVSLTARIAVFHAVLLPGGHARRSGLARAIYSRPAQPLGCVGASSYTSLSRPAARRTSIALTIRLISIPSQQAKKQPTAVAATLFHSCVGSLLFITSARCSARIRLV